MASYKDCVFEEVCTFLDKTCVERCCHFKNKADVVEVVRCKDCEHYKTPQDPKYRNTSVLYCCRSALQKVKSTDFCSYGERSETNAETK